MPDARTMLRVYEAELMRSRGRWMNHASPETHRLRAVVSALIVYVLKGQR